MSTIYRVPDADDAAWDLFYADTEGRDQATVTTIIELGVMHVKEANPDEYDSEDLDAYLGKLGIVPVAVFAVGESW